MIIRTMKLSVITLTLVLAAMTGVSLQAGVALENINISHALNKENIMPVAIIGAGPAGLSAAVYTSRARIPTFVFAGDGVGGYLNDIKQIENWPAIPRTTGGDIAKRLQDQAESFGAQIVNDTVASVNFNTYPFELTTGNGEVISALSVIIATGFVQEKLDIPGTEKYWGNGIGICTICDAPFARGQDVIVVGDDDFAAERVLQLADYANHVVMVTRKNKLTVTATVIGYLNNLKNAELITGNVVTEVVGDGTKVTGVRLHDIAANAERVIPVSTVYLNSIYKPASSLVQNQLALDGEGYIKREPDSQATLTPGVFAAGAVTNKPNKAGPSAGFGMAAGVQVIEFMHTTVGFNSGTAKALESALYKPEETRTLGSGSVTTKAQLAQVFKEKPVTVLFAYSPQCPFCRAMYPDILEVTQDFEDDLTLVKMNANEANELSNSLTFDSVPTTFIYKDGVLVHTIRGRTNKQALTNALKAIVGQDEVEPAARGAKRMRTE